jgi:putative DNA primase/helicase
MMPAYERIGDARIRSADETSQSRKQVRGFWHHCEPAPGTPVARYLAKRGLPWLTRNQWIRWRPDCPHPSRTRCGAMIALVHDGQGDICAYHRTFLNRDGTKATHLDTPKASKGSFSGGACRLDPAGPELVVAEGIETAAAAGFRLGLPAWSAIACGNLARRMVLPPCVRCVTIAVDNDPPGRKAARAAAQRWRAEGRTVRLAMPTKPGEDFADQLRRQFGEAHHG